MYTVTKGHSKIAAKTRRGFTQKLDSLESQRELARKNSDFDSTAEMSSPKPVFHQVNGKQRSNSQRIQPEVTPYHEEIVRYISDDWNKIYREYEMNKQQSSETRGAPNITYYQDKSSPSLLQNFKPFDLENWWGKRLFHTLTHNT